MWLFPNLVICASQNSLACTYVRTYVCRLQLGTFDPMVHAYTYLEVQFLCVFMCALLLCNTLGSESSAGSVMRFLVLHQAHSACREVTQTIQISTFSNYNLTTFSSLPCWLQYTCTLHVLLPLSPPSLPFPPSLQSSSRAERTTVKWRRDAETR